MNEYVIHFEIHHLVKMSLQIQEQLLNVVNHGHFKSKFFSSTLKSFWIKIMGEHREIGTLALKSLLPFHTSYLCGSGFSVVSATKTKYRNWLDISKTLRVPLSSITPRWNLLVEDTHVQGSH